MYVSEICAEGIFVTFPRWLNNVKSRSKIALFSNERHFEIWFPKKRTITFFWSKLSKLHKKRPNFACGNCIFPKTRGNKSKPWTHSTPLKYYNLVTSFWRIDELKFDFRTRSVIKLCQELADLTYLWFENKIKFAFVFVLFCFCFVLFLFV